MKLTLLVTIGASLLFGAAAIGAYFASGLAFSGMPAGLWVAYGLGAGLTVLVGSGLFALLFYSARNGFDDLARTEDDVL